jgi:ATP-dependent Clp protease protease subunit
VVKLEQSTIEKTLVLYLFDEITMSSVGKVIEGLLRAQVDSNIEHIHLYMFTGGGSVNAGFALYDQIKLSLKPVTVIVSGACMSMGVTILQAATVRLATEHCNIMIHPVTNMGGSQNMNIEQMLQDTELLKRRNQENTKAVTERVGISLKEYEKFMGQIRYLTPQDAMKIGRNGLIDGIVG